ncbi:MAG TPA: hypothetical protein VD864_08235, partial [Nocardioides sp.]|nr:hypothetical protein [Nocardioides sp.]
MGTGRAVVRSAAVAGVVLGLAGVSLAAADGGLARLMQTPEPVVAPSFGVVAALLAAHPHARRIGALLAATALLAGVYVASSAAVAHGGAPPALAWLSVWTWVPALGLVVAVLPGVVPDGLPLRGRWRHVTTAAYAVVVAGSGLAMVAPREVPREPGRSNPGGLDLLDRWVEPLGLALAAAGVALTLLQLVSLVVRHRRASGQERRQVAWFGYGVAGTVLATLVAPSEVRALAVLLVPAAILVAATRYRLYEIDRLVNRTAVAAVLLAGAAVVYAAVAGWAAVLLGDGSPVTSFAAAFAVAIAFHPARTRVQRLVDRLLLPERLDPHRLGLELVATARAAAGPTQALQDVAELLRRRLHARSVTLVHAGARVAAAGDRPAEPAAGPVVAPAAPAVSVIALQQHGSVVGELELVVADAAGETLVQNPAVRAAVAGPLAALMHAWTLTADLERSRESIVGAREEERRRLRRDLHDG